MDMKRILVVDDEEIILRLLERVLARFGYRVETASGGQEGVRQARKNPPDLVLMDLRMPGVNGADAIRMLRADAETKEIPVIVLTGEAGARSVREAVEVGAADLLVKSSFRIETFLDRIERALRRREESRRVEEAEGRCRAAEAGKERKRVRREKRQSPSPESEGGQTFARVPALSMEEVEKRLNSVLDLQVLPFIAAEIVQVTSSAVSDSRQLTEIIERDQALTVQVLKLANSAFYSVHGRSLNLSQAVTNIGFRAIRQLVLAMSLVKERRDQARGKGLPQVEFWRHSVACGVLSRELARASGCDPDGVEDAFLAGLLHDIGQTIFNDHFSEVYSGILEAAVKRNVSILQVEQEGLGMDHTQVSGRILRKWKLSEKLLDPIERHHAPWEELLGAAAPSGRLVLIVRLAEILTRLMLIGTDSDDTYEEIPDAVFPALGIESEAVREILRKTEDQVEELTQILLLYDPKAAAASRRNVSLPATEEETFVLLRERALRCDPVELLIERLGRKVERPADFSGASPESDAAVLLCPATREWLCARLTEWDARVGPSLPRRLFVLPDGLSLGEIRSCLDGRTAVLLKRPATIREIRAALSKKPVLRAQAC